MNIFFIRYSSRYKEYDKRRPDRWNYFCSNQYFKYFFLYIIYILSHYTYNIKNYFYFIILKIKNLKFGISGVFNFPALITLLVSFSIALPISICVSSLTKRVIISSRTRLFKMHFLNGCRYLYLYLNTILKVYFTRLTLSVYLYDSDN